MSFIRINRKAMYLAVIGAAAMMAVPTPASAGTGCNNVINIFVWGCAPWDNNNGAQYPYFRKRQVTVPANRAQIIVKDGARMALINGQYYPLIGQDGASLIGQDGASIRIWVAN